MTVLYEIWISKYLFTLLKFKVNICVELSSILLIINKYSNFKIYKLFKNYMCNIHF